MAYIFPDPEGRIQMVHYRPSELSEAQKAEGHEVPDADLVRPDTGADERAVAWWEDGAVVWRTEPVPPTTERREILALRSLLVGQVSGMLADDALPTEPEKVTALFPDWSGNAVEYAVGDVVVWDGGLARCLQPHTSQASWDPASAASLWAVHRSGVTEWSQPAGSHDAYAKGERVTHAGETWGSLVDANTVEPGTDDRWWGQV